MIRIHDTFPGAQCILNNPAMVILGACVIWSLSRSDNGIRMSWFIWVLPEYRLRYRLPMVWDIRREWL